MHGRLKQLSITSALITVLVGVIVLAGWIGRVDIFTSLIPGFVTMKIDTALCFIFSGLSLWLLNKREITSTTEITIISFCTFLTLVISLFSLSEYVFKIDLGIDELFIKDYSVTGASKPGLMSPITAFNFCLIGIAICLQLFKSESYKITQILSLLVFCAALLALVETIYGVQVFYFVTFYTKMSLFASFTFILFSIGLLASQGEKGIVIIFLSDTLGGEIARRIAPAIIIIPLVLGWLTQQGDNIGLYETHFGHALFSVSSMIVFFVVILLTSKQLMKVDNERKHAEEEKEKRAEELAFANKELGQFVYAASHDLQEPLRTISNFVGLVETKYTGKLDKDADQYLKFIVTATSKMQNMIKDLMDLARLGSDISFTEVNCNELVKEIIFEFDPAIKENDAKIIFPILPVIRGNKIRLKQLFLNLISNAIKFRKKNSNPEIEITFVEKDSEYLFSVKDNGIGIDEKKREKLFIIFQRFNNGTEYPGSGLGLAICKKIVEHHNGRIWVESKLGEGSNFYFTISKKL